MIEFRTKLGKRTSRALLSGCALVSIDVARAEVLRIDGSHVEYDDGTLSQKETSGHNIDVNQWANTNQGGVHVEEKFTKFSGEPRDARENLGYTTCFWTNFEQNCYENTKQGSAKF